MDLVLTGVMIDISLKFCSAIPSLTPDFKVKVMDLEILCQSFALKFLTAHIIQTIYDGFGLYLVWW